MACFPWVSNLVFLFPAFFWQLSISLEQITQPPHSCRFAVVGGGPGGVYAAFRLSESQHVSQNSPVCLFERAAHLGGRIHSIRGLGAHSDLVVEAGAYRFVPHETCQTRTTQGQTVTFCDWTPLTSALVKQALKLPTKLYDPLSTDNNTMLKIVDGSGHNAGYLTFVEEMGRRVNATGRGYIFHGYELQALQSADDGQVRLLLQGPAGPTNVVAGSVLLNLPQQPLLRILAASEPPATFSPPLPLFAPRGHEITKLYIYYEDAWWRNYLNRTGGSFNNTNITGPPANSSSWSWNGYQFPAPLQGRYFDGDFRCDGPVSRPCRGFLEAVYAGDDQVNNFYRPYALNPKHEPARHLRQDDPVGAKLLDIVHRSLVEFHKHDLQAVGKLELVNASLPTSGILSLWSRITQGYETGCHNLKDPLAPGAQDPLDVPLFHNNSQTRERFFVQPLGAEVPVYLANEAWGWPTCWAEGSLVMSENVLQRMVNMTKPAWLTESIYEHVLYKTSDRKINRATSAGDPFLVESAIQEAERRSFVQACKADQKVDTGVVV